MTASQASPPRMVVFGAGAVGRGFVAPLFSKAGWHVTFLDVVPDLVNNLDNAGGYFQVVVDNTGRSDTWITPVSAINSADTDAAVRALASAAFAATAVGAAHLPGLAPVIARSLQERQEQGKGPLNILLCENLHDATEVLRAALNDAYGAETGALTGLASTSIGRMIPHGVRDASNPTTIEVEPYAMLPYDAATILGTAPEIPGLIPVLDGFAGYTDRKLYVHNMGHCMLAYLAHELNLTHIWEAVAHVELRYLVRAAMMESAAAVAIAHGMPMGALQHHVNDLLHRFGNRELKDTASRVGQDPVRKMQPDDRLLGAYLLCRKAGVPLQHVSLAVALGARRLELEAGWDPAEVDSYLAAHLFHDAATDDKGVALLNDQLEMLRRGAAIQEQITRIDADYIESWVV
ncbi:MAG: hypothetical protein Q4G35_04840 [Propionibacteriaceae bacterium]|nr:hypothetical protein [Propionibacteriaceae bacterium]